MRALKLILAAGAVVAFAGCSQEEEPVANRYERQKAEIENKASAFEAQVENEVSAAEARLEKEADALLNSLAVGNEVEVNEAGNVSR